jgi:hypothetical protein
MKFTIDIKVKPHVKRFLETRYSQPYFLSQNDSLGIFLFHLLRRPRRDQSKDVNLERYTDSFKVALSPNFIFDRGCTNTSSYLMAKFNSFIEEMMQEQFITFMDDRVAFGVEIKKSIFDWMAKYNFEDGEAVGYQTLKKSYYRYRIKKEEETRQMVA